MTCRLIPLLHRYVGFLHEEGNIVNIMQSDNGMNFIGAVKEIKMQSKTLNTKKEQHI